MNISISQGSIEENLKDAGCSKKQIEELMWLYKQGSTERIYLILEKHRKKVLDEIHQKEKEIDCVDYLVYRMKKLGKDKIINK